MKSVWWCHRRGQNQCESKSSTVLVKWLSWKYKWRNECTKYKNSSPLISYPLSTTSHSHKQDCETGVQYEIKMWGKSKKRTARKTSPSVHGGEKGKSFPNPRQRFILGLWGVKPPLRWAGRTELLTTRQLAPHTR